MAIRKSVQESFVVEGSREAWLNRCAQALESQNFTKVEVMRPLFQVTGNYKKATIWGDLRLVLSPEAEGTRIDARATANVDNLFALVGGSPGRKIIDRFRSGLSELPASEAPQDAELSPHGQTASELERLADLHARGVLTDAEFQSAKAKILSYEEGPHHSGSLPLKSVR